MKRVILDTNFLLIPGQFNVDIFAELDRIIHEKYEIVVLSSTLRELDRIAQGNGKAAKAAKLAQSLLKAKGLKTIEIVGLYTDDALVEAASKDSYVATQDKALKERLKQGGARIITLRQKQHLAIE